MQYYSVIAGNFQDTIEAMAMSVDALAVPIEDASALIADCLLNDHKVLACGNGADAALAQLFACSLLGQHERDRPALPAIALSTNGANLSAIGLNSGINDIYSRQLRALGQAGDVLLCLSSAEGDTSLLRAIQAARDRNMVVTALSNTRNGELGALLGDGDVQMCIEAPRPARVREIQTAILHCICELVDRRLFGNQE